MKKLQIIEQKDERVLLTEQIAEAFDTDVDRIQVNFNRNKERFIEEKHYFRLEGNVLRDFKTAYQIDNQLKHARVLYLWTEKGAWLHAKSLNTERAWEAYERLVDDYYDLRELQPSVPLQTMNERSVRMELLKTALDHEERIGSIEERINSVERSTTLDYGEQRKLQRLISKRVYELELDSKERPELFRQVHREIRDRWGVGSYRDVRRTELDEVVAYIKAWRPRLVVV